MLSSIPLTSSQHISINSRFHLIPPVIATLILFVYLSGCSVIRPSGIADLSRLPQNAAEYLPKAARQASLLSPNEQKIQANHYRQRFFSPWNRNKANLSANDAFWGEAAYGSKQGYAENLQPYTLAGWDKLVASQQKALYPSLARKAITTQTTMLRVFPTNKPFFLNPQKAGEGFPFDYFQNSTLWIGTPLLVTHRSADDAWLHVESGHSSGWLRAESIGWITEAQQQEYTSLPLATCVREYTPLYQYTEKACPLPVHPRQFLTKAKLGTLLPARTLSSLLLPLRTASGDTLLVSATYKRSSFAPFPQIITPAAIATVANTIIGQPYGWGGLFENRDCSATMRDIFTPFGIWLPRNSKAQAMYGGVEISLKELTPSAKRHAIKTHGIPYFTLINFKGHVGLYLGMDKNTQSTPEPVMLHNAWGVKTVRNGKAGRAIIGKFAITTLRAGEERSDVQPDTFYKKLTGITLLPPSPL